MPSAFVYVVVESNKKKAKIMLGLRNNDFLAD